MEAAYERFRSKGALPASVEAVFGQAWGATATQRAHRVVDEIAVPLERIPRRR
jgi:hypothetical protein